MWAEGLQSWERILVTGSINACNLDPRKSERTSVYNVGSRLLILEKGFQYCIKAFNVGSRFALRDQIIQLIHVEHGFIIHVLKCVQEIHKAFNV